MACFLRGKLLFVWPRGDGISHIHTFFGEITLPETNSSNLKMDGYVTFRGRVLCTSFFVVTVDGWRINSSRF